MHTERNADILKETGTKSLTFEVGATPTGASLPDSAYADGQAADRAVEHLRRFGETGEPFFLAVGFFKPHLPFNAPKKYWDMIDPESVMLATNKLLPRNAPTAAFQNDPEVETYAGVSPERPLPEELARHLVHGYLACTAFIDAQVGEVLAELKRSGLDNDTIVVFTSDHGFMIGEHGLWAKYYTLELSLHVPLIIALPRSDARLQTPRARGLAALIDLYPTLTDLAGLPHPSTHTLAGTSLVPMLLDAEAPVRSSVYSRWELSDSIRTDTHRITRFISTADQVVGWTVFDLNTDPTQTVSNTADPGTFERLRRKLSDAIARSTEAIK